MPSGKQPFLLYFAHMPHPNGWTPGMRTVDPAALADAENVIASAHPTATAVRVVAQGVSDQIYGPETFGRKDLPLEHVLDNGWWFDTRDYCWLPPEEEAAKPVEKPLPAVMELETEDPCNGWWLWRMTFSPLVSNDRALWERLFGRDGKVRYAVELSRVHDPLPGIEGFLSAVRRGADARVVINEEDGFTGILAWPDGEERMHLRVMSLCRPKDRRYDFLLTRVDFLNVMEKARRRFLAVGGWSEAETE